MFLGEYEYKVDSKGRLPLPPKFRQEFGDGLILTQGPEKCIVAYRVDEWQKLAEKAKTVPSYKVRTFNRGFFGMAFSLTIDGQGRIALPSHLRRYAQIDDVATIIGNNNYVEIWNPDLWNAERISIEQQMWQIMESLEEQQ